MFLIDEEKSTQQSALLIQLNNFRVNLASRLSILGVKLVFKYIYSYKLVMNISWMLPSTR